jgi:hypothetical protein
VYYGILENPFFSNGLKGRLLHFNKELTVQKTSGAFGWDMMPTVVPKSSVPGYLGTSSYLLLCKYNNYVEGGGDGINKLGILDPNDTQLDPRTNVPIMKEILTVPCPTPDLGNRDVNHPNAVREWCINTCVVDYVGRCALAGAEDGVLYRWDFVSGQLTESIRLSPGVGEAYTPTIVGPTGIVYAINNATLFAIGNSVP